MQEENIQEKNEIMTTTHPNHQLGIFSNVDLFELGQRMAKMLASSDLVPKTFKGNIANVTIALELSNRIGASPLAVMQSIYIVHGKPSWSSAFIIAALNTCGRFFPLRYDMQGKEGEMDRSCAVWTYDKTNREKLFGPRVSMEMAKKEGWLTKEGSKWKTMPELMLRYRAAAFFGRLYAPDVLNGMKTVQEIKDSDIDETEMLQQELDKNANKEVIDIATRECIEKEQKAEPATVGGNGGPDF